MSWYEQAHSSPFEREPIEGVWLLYGDICARLWGRDWPQGMKRPSIVFPSGAMCELWGVRYPIVHISDMVDLPLNEDRDTAFVTALEWNEDSYYSVFKVDDDQLEVWDHNTESVYRICYDNAQERISDVRWLDPAELPPMIGNLLV